MSSTRESELKRKAKALQKLFKELEGGAVIVEGKRDRLALENIGVKARVIEYNQSAEKVASRLEGEKKAFILTDFDRRGEEKASAIAGALAAYSVEADLDARRTLKRVLGIRFVEDAFARFQEFVEECKENKIEIR